MVAVEPEGSEPGKGGPSGLLGAPSVRAALATVAQPRSPRPRRNANVRRGVQFKGPVPVPVGAALSPLHRAGARPPGGGFEGRTESCLAVDSGDDQPHSCPRLSRRRGTCAWAPGRGPPHLLPRIRVLPAGSWTGGDSWVDRLRVAPGAASTLKEQRDGWLGMGVSQGERGRGAARPH